MATNIIWHNKQESYTAQKFIPSNLKNYNNSVANESDLQKQILEYHIYTLCLHRNWISAVSAIALLNFDRYRQHLQCNAILYRLLATSITYVITVP